MPDGKLVVRGEETPPVNHTKGRLTVVEMTYHQLFDAQPTCAENRFSRDLGTDEQPYVRRLRVGAPWQALDCGWLDPIGMVVIKNEEGRFNVIPTEEEKAQMAAKILEVGFESPEGPRDMHSPARATVRADILIPPGESVRFCPGDPKRVRLRCLAGEIRYSLTLFPL